MGHAKLEIRKKKNLTDIDYTHEIFFDKQLIASEGYYDDDFYFRYDDNQQVHLSVFNSINVEQIPAYSVFISPGEIEYGTFFFSDLKRKQEICELEFWYMLTDMDMASWTNLSVFNILVSKSDCMHSRGIGAITNYTVAISLPSKGTIGELVTLASVKINLLMNTAKQIIKTI